MTEGLPDLADRLNDLFARVPKPESTQPYSNDAVAEALTDQGVSVTGVYLSQIRNGRKTNPSARLLGGLAKFFGVPIAYFYEEDEAATIRGQLDALASVRNARVEGIMTRARGISDENLTHVAEILERIRKIEGLDEEPKLGPTEGDKP